MSESGALTSLCGLLRYASLARRFVAGVLDSHILLCRSNYIHAFLRVSHPRPCNSEQLRFGVTFRFSPRPRFHVVFGALTFQFWGV